MTEQETGDRRPVVMQQYTVPQPWICPRCGVVNAPHVSQCTCEPDSLTQVRFSCWPTTVEFKDGT